MKETNEWISESSVVWEDPSICSEEMRLKSIEPELRRFAVETCLMLPESAMEPFLAFIELIENDNWNYRNVIQFRSVVIRIVHLLEPLHLNVQNSHIDMTKWYMIEDFSESWKSKIEDVLEMWNGELQFLMN
ncbi:hypothetical protein [Phaeocystidibacter luteus]|uniref:Uncharacterized protein n=1 Tax=Phaeocystidibacter luteus TaxID=911197 RepID=A0A6N6RLR7_9FLAO|nr:hypothetical protein [Phaeocystidibacter luteus]KAB2814502.1 hypothetical protein F8C67_01830 [Phaeocystidibacter luteus]